MFGGKDVDGPSEMGAGAGDSELEESIAAVGLVLR